MLLYSEIINDKNLKIQWIYYVNIDRYRLCNKKKIIFIEISIQIKSKGEFLSPSLLTASYIIGKF
jgi:hypothetical protein